MPIKSKKQLKMMEAVAHGSKMHGIGPSKEVADEMLNSTSKKKKSMFMKKGK